MRYLMIALVLVALLLAGCLGGSGADAGPDQTTPGGAPTDGPTTSTEVDAAEPAASAHVHDRWEGQIEKVLLDETLDSASRTDVEPSDPVIVTFSRVLGGPSQIRFRLPEGRIVPPGTSHLTINATWGGSDLPSADQAGHRRAGQLAYRDAGGPNFEWLNETTSPGDWRINTTVEMADDGHAKASVWEFIFDLDSELYAEGFGISTPQFTSNQISLDVKIVAHRVDGDLPKEPAHPDWFANGSALAVHESTSEGEAVGAWFLQWGADTGSVPPIAWYPAADVVNGTEHRIIPPGTELLVAELNWTNESPTASATSVTPDLQWNNGLWFEWNDWEASTTEDGRRVYKLPVQEGMTDGMYQGISRWRFRYGFFGQDTGVDEPLFGSDVRGPFHFDGSWTFTVTAYNVTEAP